MKDTITLRDVYDIVNRLEEKMDQRLTKVEEKQERTETTIARGAGALAVLSIFASGLSTFVWDRILGRS